MDEPERTPVGDRVTIYPRGKKKTYVADFWRDGKHCRLSLKTTNKKAALQRAAALAADLTAGRHQGAPERVPFDRAVADYLALLRTEGKAPRTLVKYRGVYDLLLGHLRGKNVSRLDQFTIRHFDRYREERSAVRRPKTVYTEGVIILQLFSWCRSRRLIAVNPLAEVRLKKPPFVPKEGPTLAEVNRILGELAGTRRTMVAVLAFTGMRAGELQRLTPADLDLKDNWLRVVSRKGLETKTRTSRNVPMHARLRALLEPLPASDKPWLFTMLPSDKYPKGDHWINIKKLNEDFQAAVLKAGLPTGREGGFTLHSLRHFFETHTVNSHIPQRVIDHWLGHHSDRSMGAVYYRLTDADSQSFMRKVPFGDGTDTHDIVQKD
jgi:integrase